MGISGISPQNYTPFTKSSQPSPYAPSPTPDAEEEKSTQTEATSGTDTSDENNGSAEETQASQGNEQELSAEDLKKVEKLKARDLEVKAHEMAHVSAGGKYIRGGLIFSIKPDRMETNMRWEVMSVLTFLLCRGIPMPPSQRCRP